MIKYSGIALLLLTLFTVAGTLQVFHQRGAMAKAPSENSQARSLLARVHVDNGAQSALKAANAVLQRASRVSDHSGGAEHIIDVPQRITASIIPPQKKIVKRVAHIHHHIVSMVYSGDKQNYAVVDGHFCMPGTHVRAGDKVERIRPGSVLISRGKLKRWFYVKKTISDDMK